MSSIVSPTEMASSSSSSSVESKSKFPMCLPGTPVRWFFSLNKLTGENPSLRSGIDLEKELSYRQQAACFIHDLGIKLHLPHWVMNVAIVYMHRFYVFHSFKRFHRNDLAAAALFLAAKVEEMPRKLEHIVKISYAYQHRDEPPLDIMSDKYMEEANKIATYENILLQTLGFDLNVEVPNTYVVKHIQELNAPKPLAFAAFSFTTDSLHLTTLCLRYRPPVVACACIYLACDWAKWEIPSHRSGRPWYSFLDPEVTPELLKAMADELVSVFQRCPERIRNRRHLATVKRDSSGAVVPSSIMVESSNYVSLGDLNDRGSTSGFSHSPVPPPLPVIPLPPASVKFEAGATLENGGKLASVHCSAKITATTSVIGSEAAVMSDSPKKPRSETSRVDLNLYKERIKARESEKQKNGPEESTVRKSFIPDMSSLGQDSWLFGANDKDDEPKDPKTVIGKDTATKESNTHPKPSSSDRQHDRQGDDRISRNEEHRQSRRDDRGHHRPSGNHREDKSKSDRSSSTDLSRSLKEKHRSREKPNDPSVASPSYHQHRSHTTNRERGSPHKEGHTPQEMPPARGDRQYSYAGHSTPIGQESSKKRRHNESKLENGLMEGPSEKSARVYDYEHGPASKPKTVIDYEFGNRIVADYGHGRRDEFGYTETKASSSFSSSSGVANGKAPYSMETNGTAYSPEKRDQPGKSEARNSDGRYRDYGRHRPSRPRPSGGSAQSAAIDRHFQSIGQHLCVGAVPKTEPSSHHVDNGHPACSDVSSIVGNRIPSDDILRQATEKAEKMQRSEKWERLEKLKHTNFAAIPLAAIKVTKPPNTNDGWSRSRQGEPP